MLIVLPTKFRRQRGKWVSPVAGPTNLVLEAASYDSVLMLVLLTFNQPVNTAGAVVAQFTVDDPVTHFNTFTAAGPVVAYGANGVQIHLLATGSPSGLSCYPKV